MRYSKQHKQETRQKILSSACRLFTAKGFDATSIDEIMLDCALTRGGFYAHFKSKSRLYHEAIQLNALQSNLAVNSLNSGDFDHGKREWLDSLLDDYLEVEVQLRGRGMSRLAFFATDVASEVPDVRTAYAAAFKTLSDELRARIAIYSRCSEATILSLTAMIIGALSIAQTIDDIALKQKTLAACKEAAQSLVADDHGYPPMSFFWEIAQPTRSARHHSMHE